jgi:hypothetical protein
MLARKGYAPVTFEQDDTGCGLLAAFVPIVSNAIAAEVGLQAAQPLHH